MTETPVRPEATAGEIEAARWLFANHIDVLVIIEQGVITRVNAAWTSLTGWAADQVVGRGFMGNGLCSYGYGLSVNTSRIMKS